jgi:hypothetical protein
MVASLKLKGIDGRAHKEWNLRLNLTQHAESHKIPRGYEEQLAELFLNSPGGGAWSFLVRGVICQVNSANERDTWPPIKERVKPPSRAQGGDGLGGFASLSRLPPPLLCRSLARLFNVSDQR